MVKTISYIDGIKGLHTKCTLASCFVSFAHEHLCDYHGIALFKLFLLLVLCAINPFFTGGLPCKWSIVRKFVVWLMLFALLVERCWFIKDFRICWPKVCSLHLLRLLLTKAKLWCLLSCLSKRTAEEIVEMQVSRKLMKLTPCLCYVICHSLTDDITGPVCGVTTGHQWIPIAMDHWRGSSFGGPVDSPHKRSVWCFLLCLPGRAALPTIELPLSWDPMTRMRCHYHVSFVIPTFNMVEHHDDYVIVTLKV